MIAKLIGLRPFSALRTFRAESRTLDRKLFETVERKYIRNFCIIAHIDHGKSTLADRLLEMTGTVEKLEKGEAQVLDTLQVERERGITVIAQTASMLYRHQVYKAEELISEEDYILNLIDTPGHVDFTIEVERAVAVLDGAALIVECAPEMPRTT